MLLIVGLGNPGKEYEGTRHNVGFVVVEALAKGAGLKWKNEAKFKGEVAKGKIGGRDVVLLKPKTFMNLSGDSVVPATHFFKIDAKAQLFVVHDDLDLSAGALKISTGAGAGGHNGVKSLIERLGHNDFTRFRLGIGRPTGQLPIEDYVLRRPTKEETTLIKPAMERCVEALIKTIESGVTAAMNKFNG